MNNYFIYHRDSQTIRVADDISVPVKLFLERVPDFRPPREAESIMYFPGVRLSMHHSGSQFPLPQFAHRPDATTWSEGDRYIVEALEAHRVMKQRQAIPPVLTDTERA